MSRTPQRFEEPKRDGKAVGGGVEGRTYGAIAIIASPFRRTRTAKNHAVLQIFAADACVLIAELLESASVNFYGRARALAFTQAE